jgi:gentisate 1,2-dioxygenase
MWHEHGHDGTDPVIWLDVLDLPIVYYIEASYHEESVKQEEVPTRPRETIIVLVVWCQHQCLHVLKSHIRVYRYPWSDVKQTLITMANDDPSALTSYRLPT